MKVRLVDDEVVEAFIRARSLIDAKPLETIEPRFSPAR
jgi:hypothetical protein